MFVSLVLLIYVYVCVVGAWGEGGWGTLNGGSLLLHAYKFEAFPMQVRARQSIEYECSKQSTSGRRRIVNSSAQWSNFSLFCVSHDCLYSIYRLAGTG